MGFGKTVLAVGLGVAVATAVVLPVLALVRSKIGV
jgi:hypothetical protein